MFGYNRPSTTQKVIEALSRQNLIPEKIIVFIDKIKNPNDQAKYEEVVFLFKKINWTDVEINLRETNFGCAPNIISGLDRVFSKYREAIIVEDDILVVPNFYYSLCSMLKFYEKNKNILTVGGYPSILPNELIIESSDTFISPRFSSWGWGTWSDRWFRLGLSNWKNPYHSIDDIPMTAGDDIRIMADDLEKDSGAYWDVKIALSSLYSHSYHALTKYYMVNNIGLDSGDHPNSSINVNEFSKKYNPLVNRIPVKLAAPIYLSKMNGVHQRYIDAVRKYNALESKNTKEFILGRPKRIIKKVRARLKG